METPAHIQYKLNTLKHHGKDRIAQELEKQIYHILMKWWAFFHIDRICDEELSQLQYVLDFIVPHDHEWIELPQQTELWK